MFSNAWFFAPWRVTDAPVIGPLFTLGDVFAAMQLEDVCPVILWKTGAVTPSEAGQLVLFLALGDGQTFVCRAPPALHTGCIGASASFKAAYRAAVPQV